MAELGYWVAGADEYRYPRDTGVTLDDVLSLFAYCYIPSLRLPV